MCTPAAAGGGGNRAAASVPRRQPCSPDMLVLIAAAVLLLVLALMWPRRPAGGPPGPAPVPVLGTAAFLGARTRTELFDTLQRLAERFGPVVGFFAGATYHV